MIAKPYNFDRVLRVYIGSNGDDTRNLYSALEALGPVGIVALNLFRACKTSQAAKRYHGGIRGRGSYRSMAYQRKEYSIDQLARVLTDNAAALGIAWGWKIDEAAEHAHRWVIYVDLPTHGQVSFHLSSKGVGPIYDGEWDRQKDTAPTRICRYCATLLRAGADSSNVVSE